jgi:hypothetical protein
MAVKLSMLILWIVMSCRFIGRYQYFGATLVSIHKATQCYMKPMLTKITWCFNQQSCKQRLPDSMSVWTYTLRQVIHRGKKQHKTGFMSQVHPNNFLLSTQDVLRFPQWWRWQCCSYELWCHVDWQVDISISEKHNISVRVENITNKTEAYGNRSAQFCITTVVQQLFHATLCETSNLREWHFRLNHTLQFYGTNLMQMVSSGYGPS